MTPRPATAALAAVLAAALAAAGCSRAGPGRRRAAGAGPRTAWSWAAPPPSSVGMPAVDAEGAVFTYGHKALVSLDGSGRRRWETARVGLRDVAPQLAGGVVLAATDEGVAAFDRADGRPRWDTVVGERANTPVVAGGRAVVDTWEGSLVALDLEGGRVAWRVPLPGPALGPAATDGRVVVATWEAEDGTAAGAVAVEAEDGRRRWQVDLPPGGVSGPALVGGSPGAAAVAVVVAGDLSAHALELERGQERWRTDVDGQGSPEVPPLPLAGGEVLVAHRLGGLVLLNAATGRERWRVSSDGAAVAGGPVGPGPRGRFALPLDDGRVLLAGPDRPTDMLQPPGLASGAAVTPDGLLLVGTADARANVLMAQEGW